MDSESSLKKRKKREKREINNRKKGNGKRLNYKIVIIL